MGIFSRIRAIFERFQRRPVLGLALGSGGAKGMAHLGALKAFEEEGLDFSVIAGSSIGAIVGALYAKGYTVRDMMGIVEGLNRREFSKNLRPFGDLGFARTFLEQYLDGDIAELNKPFAAWVTEAKSNCGFAMKAGDLPRILTASAAIPPFFRAVEIDGIKYYDGAFTNGVPAETCRDLGADFVLGIDLAAFMRSDEEKSMVSRLLGNAISFVMPVKYTEDCRTRGYEAADFMLRPNLHDYLATDVSRPAMDAMFEIGYREAKTHMEEIKRAIKEKRHEKGRKTRG